MPEPDTIVYMPECATSVICSVTGHRPDKLGREYDYIGPYSDHIRKRFREILTDLQPDQCISGMALGVDTLFCQVAIELDIPVQAAIPFEGQESRWPAASQKLYNDLLAHPLVTKYVVCEGGYASAKMQIRNEFMVDAATHLCTVWNGSEGGTMNCVRYAQKQHHIEIIRINPDGWRKPEQEQQTLF